MSSKAMSSSFHHTVRCADFDWSAISMTFDILVVSSAQIKGGSCFYPEMSWYQTINMEHAMLSSLANIAWEVQHA